jgi:hypothetical protein
MLQRSPESTARHNVAEMPDARALANDATFVDHGGGVGGVWGGHIGATLGKGCEGIQRRVIQV